MHRQHDPEFIDLLNGIRTRTVTDEQLERLNQQVDKKFEPEQDDYYVYLTPTNKPARSINENRLSELSGTTETFEAEVTGSFEDSRAPTRRTLELKCDAQVMMLNNDSSGRWVNGTMGKVREMKNTDDEKHVKVHLENDRVVKVTPFQWEMIEFEYDSRDGQLEPTTLGTFEQVPMRLSWAVTIHKSQGKTLDRVVLDTTDSGMFAHGQAYVALSRCTTLNGLVLKKPLRKKDVWMDYRVTNFFKEMHLEQEDRMDRDALLDQLEQAIEAKADVEIIYVNSKGEKSRRRIQPREVGTFTYHGNSYEGLDAYSYKHNEPRQFSFKRIARAYPVNDE